MNHNYVYIIWIYIYIYVCIIYMRCFIYLYHIVIYRGFYDITWLSGWDDRQHCHGFGQRCADASGYGAEDVLGPGGGHSAGLCRVCGDRWWTCAVRIRHTMLHCYKKFVDREWCKDRLKGSQSTWWNPGTPERLWDWSTMMPDALLLCDSSKVFVNDVNVNVFLDLPCEILETCWE